MTKEQEIRSLYKLRNWLSDISKIQVDKPELRNWVSNINALILDIDDFPLDRNNRYFLNAIVPHYNHHRRYKNLNVTMLINDVKEVINNF